MAAARKPKKKIVKSQGARAPVKKAPGKTAKGTRYAAFLRGINIGGRTVPMPELAAMFTAAGCTDVATYIQSGNVVFTKTGALEDVTEKVERALEKRAGFSAKVVVRSEAELRALLENAPFPDPKGAKPALHVVLLAREPTKAELAKLDPNRSPGDEFRVVGKDVYLLCPNGYGQSKLTNAYFDQRLETTSTVRNFRTIETMLEMCGRF